MSKLSIVYQEVARPANTPVKQIKVNNATGYLDLIVHKNKNGKAIRISDKFGDNRVFVTLAEVPALIEALQLAKAVGVKTSVDDVTYATA